MTTSDSSGADKVRSVTLPRADERAAKLFPLTLEGVGESVGSLRFRVTAEILAAEDAARSKAFEKAAKLVDAAFVTVTTHALAPYFNSDTTPPNLVVKHEYRLEWLADAIRVRAKEAPK